MNNEPDYSGLSAEDIAYLQGLPTLSTDEVEQGFMQGTEVLLTNIEAKPSFEKMSYETQYGLGKDCGAYTADFYRGAMDINKLIKDLKENKTAKDFFFFYQNYTNNLPTERKVSPTMMGGAYISTEEVDNPYIYKNSSTKVEKTAQLKVSLNTRACNINIDEFGYRIALDKNKKIIEYYLELIYTDAHKYKKDFIETKDILSDYTINDKYKAITIETLNANDFYAIGERLGETLFFQEQLMEFFVKELKENTDPSYLKFIYEQMPDVVIKSISAHIDYEILFNHFNLLTEYDYIGFWSGWRDSSNAIMVNLRCMEGYYDFLLEDLHKKPELIKQVYQNLDGSSDFGGVEIRNRTIYTTILSAICHINQYKGLNITSKIYKYGNGYELDSNINKGYDKDKNTIFLQQNLKKTKTTEVPDQRRDEFGITENFGEKEVTYSYYENIDEGTHFHPLDMVLFMDYREDNPELQLVPAIFLKSISDEKEWEEVNRMIRIGIDVAAVLLGVATLGSTTGIWAALAIADITIATADAIIQTYKPIIEQEPGGKEFLKAWETFYLVGGAITAGPQVIRTLVVGGPKLLTSLGKLTTEAGIGAKEFVKASIIKVTLEINISNFTADTVKILQTNKELVLVTNGILDQFKASKLLESGCLILEGTAQIGKTTQQELAVFYKGAIVAKGTHSDKNFLDILRKLKKVTPQKAKLVNLLEELALKSDYSKMMPDNCKIIPEKSSYTFKDLITKEDIGLVSLKDKYLEFAIYRKGLQTKVSGQRVFNCLIQHLKVNKVSFKGIKGLWSISSDNTIAFNKALREGKSLEDAAFETWTGKRALDHGFNKVKIDKLAPNKPPYTSIVVTFYN